jgi:lysyl-tRNA synthetase class 2
LSETERDVRRARLAQLRADGVAPFPARVGSCDRVAALRDAHGARSVEDLEADPTATAVAGRVMSIRSFGKLVFATLREDGDQLQVSARKGDTSPEHFARLKALDVGDFARVSGTLWRTRTDELTVAANEVELLAKGLRPLPEKWSGLRDVETRFRQRYLDLLVNDKARGVALLRSRTVRAMRTFLDGRGFVEVETPVLQPIYGGAAARPFTTRHNVYGQTLFLRVSDELYLKRLIIGGLDRVYEIGRDFRNEGVSRKHNPEFTMMECYQAFADYHDMMDLCEVMLQAIAHEVLGAGAISFQGSEIELGGRWPRIPLRDALEDATGIDFLEATDFESLANAVVASGRSVPEAPTWGKLVDELVGEYVEPNLVQPTFLTDYPVELSPLAKRSSADPRLVERFELFIAGMELANAFSELNDPDDQRARFEAQSEAQRRGDDEAHPLDEDYLAALEYGTDDGFVRLAHAARGAPLPAHATRNRFPARRGERWLSSCKISVGAWRLR